MITHAAIWKFPFYEVYGNVIGNLIDMMVFAQRTFPNSSPPPFSVLCCKSLPFHLPEADPVA